MTRFFTFQDMERIRQESQALVEASQHLQSECVRLRMESQEIKSWKRLLIDQLGDQVAELAASEAS